MKLGNCYNIINHYKTPWPNETIFVSYSLLKPLFKVLSVKAIKIAAKPLIC